MASDKELITLLLDALENAYIDRTMLGKVITIGHDHRYEERRIMAYAYEWETCLLDTDDWERMIERRNKGNWRMVSACVPKFLSDGRPVAYVFWKRAFPKP